MTEGLQQWDGRPYGARDSREEKAIESMPGHQAPTRNGAGTHLTESSEAQPVLAGRYLRGTPWISTPHVKPPAQS
jgi:hypothetical protein